MKSALSYRGRCENEASRRLYRGAAETAQRLEHNLNQISNFHNLFSPEITDLRTRLKDFCERLMFTDPVAYGKKAEDLLWRKVYYEFFQKCKQNKKKLIESEFHHRTLHCHLLAAIGSYHHMLLRIQTEFHVDLNAKVDVPFMWHMKGVKKERWKKYQQSSAGDSAIQTWAYQATHRILTYLGDLARYISELQPEHNPDPENRHLAQRYYLQAFSLNPKNGIPHNQLASLANNRFDSAYHYMRCLSSVEKFDAAEGNLRRVFEKNAHVIEELDAAECASGRVLKCKRFLAKFLRLCDIFYFSSDENLQKYCQEALQEFDSCVLPDEASNPECSSSSDPVYLDSGVVFKIIVMCMMCISRLHDRGSSDVSTATAFTLALFSSVVHSCIQQLRLSVYENIPEQSNDAEQASENAASPALDGDDNNMEDIVDKMNEVNEVTSSEKKSFSKKGTGKKLNVMGLRKLRRRRKISSTSQEDSEISDVEVLELAESDEENGVLNSDVSQTGSCSSESLSEHEDLLAVENNNAENESKSTSEAYSDDVYTNHTDTSDKETLKKENSDIEDELSSKEVHQNFSNGSTVVLLSPEKIMQVLLKAEFMSNMKVLVDWLRAHKELLTLCAESLQFLLSRLTELFNLLLKVETELLKVKDDFLELQRSRDKWSQTVPLPEDVLLQCLPCLESVHCHLNFNILRRIHLSSSHQLFLRVQCVVSFGDELCKSPEALLSFDEEENKFIFKALDLTKQDKDAIKSPDGNDRDVVNNDMENQRQQLMHEMAHLWLKSEVNNLEMSIKSSASPQLSPLLVAETSALCHHLPLLKQLVAAKRFVVIVPRVVIDNLDHLKKKSLGAREAIRWLEFIFQKGSRHVRTQRDAEKSGLHPMKYPKRKDKEAWDFFQVLECCNFLVQQQQQTEKSSCTLVTLLIGTTNHLPGNAAAVAKSLNISMEDVESFFAKWRSCTKKPG